MRLFCMKSCICCIELHEISSNPIIIIYNHHNMHQIPSNSIREISWIPILISLQSHLKSYEIISNPLEFRLEIINQQGFISPRPHAELGASGQRPHPPAGAKPPSPVEPGALWLFRMSRTCVNLCTVVHQYCILIWYIDIVEYIYIS